ncbi:XdhC family protein [Conexibacter arvalis]|uniref:Xanthine dehydrogenase accessory factor n=1 Tax=Conexibacter arvalis TaxID=912552 RepID=A0A840ICW0_9ACTN|nr:XdhC family protein [Conexibacter arvalis]MBB4662081.1 xanthine dehydrogenase accessory factor [Conexibacter arvalis]
MSAAEPIARRAELLRADGMPYVEATIVRVEHPASVRPGDAALVEADGTIDGFLGGHCAQASVRLHAARVLETGEPLLLRIVPEPAPGGAAAPDDGTAVEHNPCLSGGAFDVFLQPRLPAPRMVVVGDAPIARALGELARAAGYEVAAVAAEEAERARPAAGDAACVVAAHGVGDEAGALAAALREGVPYVALVASARRGAAVLDALEAPDELRDRVHVPAGLDIGAQTPVEVALSILAELVAERRAAPVLTGRDGRP